MEGGGQGGQPQPPTSSGVATSSDGRPRKLERPRLGGSTQESREGQAGETTLVCNPSNPFPPRHPVQAQSRLGETSLAEAHYNPGVFGDTARDGLISLSPPSNLQVEARGEYREALMAQEEGFFYPLH